MEKKLIKLTETRVHIERIQVLRGAVADLT